MTNDEVLLASDRMTAMIRRIFCAAGANNQEAQAIAANRRLRRTGRAREAKPQLKAARNRGAIRVSAPLVDGTFQGA